MNIIAVRHGETEGNISHLVESRSPGKLSAAGIEQARKVARLLQDEHFDAIYSSDLQRCIDTAQIIAAYHDGTEFVVTDQLRERNQGIYEGKHWEDLPWFEFEGKFLDQKIPEGESWLNVEQRIATTLNHLYKVHVDETILLVTHGGPIKALRALLAGMTLEESVDQHVDNATVWHGKMSHSVKPSSASMR